MQVYQIVRGFCLAASFLVIQLRTFCFNSVRSDTECGIYEIIAGTGGERPRHRQGGAYLPYYSLIGQRYVCETRHVHARSTENDRAIFFIKRAREECV